MPVSYFIFSESSKTISSFFLYEERVYKMNTSGTQSSPTPQTSENILTDCT